jgi:dienelactone hydrolase
VLLCKIVWYCTSQKAAKADKHACCVRAVAACRRADSIVADAEVVRKALVPRNATTQDGKWSILGQSFGGFCALTYLSHAPQGKARQGSSAFVKLDG